MAKIKRRQDKRSNLTIYEISGAISTREVVSFLEGEDATRVTDKQLFDFRLATLTALGKEDVKNELRAALKLRRPVTKTAFVFANSTDFSVGKLASQLANRLGNLSEVRGFYNPYWAKGWLLF